jgi:hypothetical protein
VSHHRELLEPGNHLRGGRWRAGRVTRRGISAVGSDVVGAERDNHVLDSGLTERLALRIARVLADAGGD